MSVHAWTGFLTILLPLLSMYHTFAAGRCSHCGRGQIDSTAESASYMLTRDNHVVGVMSRCESNKGFRDYVKAGLWTGLVDWTMD